VPARTPLHSLSAGLFRRWPRLERFALAALDLPCRMALAPFRRARVAGQPGEAIGLVQNTDAFNTAAERYFVNFPDPDYLLNKPFSDTHAVARHLINAGVLIEALRLRRGDVVAEIGAGSCWLSHMLNRAGYRTVSIDVSATALALGRRMFEQDPRTNRSLQPAFLPYDGHRLPLDDGGCDAIVVVDAFHHIPNQRELLSEMHRVLRPHGIVAMSEPGYGHAAAEASIEEAGSGVLENELVLENLAALARACGFAAVNVVISGADVRREIPAADLGAFMGGKGFAPYWKAMCSSLEQHHFIVAHKGSPVPTTARPGRLLARIEVAEGERVQAAPGAGIQLSVCLANIGDTVWLSGQGQGWTRLGAHLYDGGQERRLIDFDWLRVELPRDVAPGEQVSLPVTLPPVASRGECVVLFDLVVEGMVWFAEHGSSPAPVLVSVGTRRGGP
jgi:SAM-dependent methyltransferase